MKLKIKGCDLHGDGSCDEVFEVIKFYELEFHENISAYYELRDQYRDRYYLTIWDNELFDNWEISKQLLGNPITTGKMNKLELILGE